MISAGVRPAERRRSKPSGAGVVVVVVVVVVGVAREGLRPAAAVAATSAMCS